MFSSLKKLLWGIMPMFLDYHETSANFGARGHSTTCHNYVYWAGGLGLFCLPMAPGRYPEHDMALNPLGT
jgi:hypothetical protein